MRMKGLLGLAVLAAGAAAAAFASRSRPAPAPAAPRPATVSPGETPAATAPGPAFSRPAPPAAPIPEAVPPAPAAPAAQWSDWSEPVMGLSCRALLPGRAFRGDRLPVTVAFRVDPALLPKGKKYISLREDQGRLVLRKRGTEASEPVAVEYACERILETHIIEEEGVETPQETELEMHPDWTPLPDAVGESREFRFSLARKWDALAPGEWEVRFEIDAFSTGESPSLWSGSLASIPVPFVIEEAPPRRIHALVPSLLRVQPGSFRGTVGIGFGEGDGDFADIEPRNGFRMCIRTGTDEVFSWGLLEEAWQGFEFGEEFDSLIEGGPLDRTLDLAIIETVADPGVPLLDLEFECDRKHSRTLWKKSFRVTATAAEIEALRR